jgi:type IV pilus assembly protein PilO
MAKHLDKLPYDDLEGVKVAPWLAGAIGVGLVLFLTYYLTLYRVTNEEYKKLTTEKEGAEKILKQYKSTLSKQGLVAKNMSRVKGRFDMFKNKIPGQDEIPTLMQRLIEFTKKRNVKMTAITMEEGSIKGFYKEIPYKIQITGEFWDTLDFIEYAQNLLRLVSFENLILQGQSVSESDVANEQALVGSLNTTLTAKTFSFLENFEDRSAQKKILPKLTRASKKNNH